MLSHTNLRKLLDSSQPEQWESIITDALENDTSKLETLEGRLLGFSVDDIIVNDEYIQATVCFLMLTDFLHDEDGLYQDEDGNSYDQNEQEYTFHVTISDNGTIWES